MSLPTSTWGLEADANRIKKTYVKGYMDVSGGELSVHNTAFNVFNSAGDGALRVDPQKITVKDDTGQIVDISLSYLTFLNNLVPADGQAVSIPEKVKYIFTSGTETRIGKPDASSNFRVYGNTYVEQFLFVGMDASFGQNVLIRGDVSLNGNLYVNSKSRFNGDLSLNGNLFVYGGDASLNRNLFVSRDASLNGNLYVASRTRLGGDLSLNGNFAMYGGDASLNGLLLVSKDASLNGNLYVASKTRMGGDLSLNGNLFVYGGDASLNRNLLVSKDASLNGNLFVGFRTRLGGDLSLNGNFAMYGGDASLNGLLLVSRDASLNGNLFVASRTRMGGDLSLNGNFAMYGGDASLNGLLLVSKDASLNGNLYVASRTRLGGDLSLNGNLFVYGGDASLNGLLLVSRDASLNGNLYVASKSRFGGDLSLNGNFTMYGGDASLNGLLLVGRDASLNGNLYVRGRTTFYEPSGSVITSGTSRGTLNLTHGDASGGSSILFQSVNSQDNDYAYIQYQENVPYAGQTSSEAGLLTIGIENDFTGVNRDRIALMPANGSGNVGVNTKFPNYNLDVSGQLRICEGTGTIASATTGSMILEHTAVGGTSSIMFKGPNSTTNDYAYIQYEDNTTYTLPLLKYDFSIDHGSNLNTGVPSTGSITVSISKSGTDVSINSFSVSGLTPVPSQFSAGIYCLSFQQYNLTSGSTSRISYIQTPGQMNIFNGSGFTFSAWIRPITTNVANCRFYILNISPGSSPSSFDIYIDGDTGRIAAICGDDSTNYKYTNILTQNEWRHYAFTFDNATSTGNHYLDGGLVTGGDVGTTYLGKQLTAVNQNILIGLKYDFNSGQQIGTTGKYAKGFNGYMNYVNMFDRALSATDIAVLYNTPGYEQSTINRGLMTLGIENEPGAIFNDRIALMPANGNGFVGINTKTPTCALDVIGSINATGPLSVSAYASMYDLSNSFSGSTALKGGLLVNNTGTGSRLILGSYYTSNINSLSAIQSSDYYDGAEHAQELLLNPLGGPIGVGTKNPGYNLDVSGTINATGASGTLLRLQNTSGYTVSGNTHIDFWNSHSTPSHTGRISSMDLTPISGTWITALSFNVRYHDGNLVEGMRIIGNSATTAKTYFNNIVGIGTTNPFYRLSLGDLNANCKLAVYDDGTGNNWYGIGANSSNLTFGAGLEQSGTPQMVLSNNGRLGIGITSPGSILDVSGEARFRGRTYFGINDPGDWNQINGSGDNAYIEYLYRSGDEATTLKIVCNNDADDHINLLPSGNVGIKTDTPTATLDVNGTVNATSYNATSDYRVKTDIKPLDVSFNVDGLKPVTYTNTRHGRQDVGFIAHEVQEHYPFLVNGQKDGEHMQSLNYIGLIGILTKEIQDLKKRLAETDAKIASLETNVGEVGSKIEDVDIKIISIGKDIDGVETRFDDVGSKVASFETRFDDVGSKVASFETRFDDVGSKVVSFETRFDDVETKVVLEQARLSICETGVAFNKSAIDDINRRFQS